MSEYDRVATKEEVMSMTEEEALELRKKAPGATILLDPDTFEPMLVVDRVAYKIKPAIDSKAKK